MTEYRIREGRAWLSLKDDDGEDMWVNSDEPAWAYVFDSRQYAIDVRDREYPDADVIDERGQVVH